MDPKLSEKVEEQEVLVCSWEGRASGSQQAGRSWWVLGVTRSRQSVGVGAEEWDGRESRVWGDSSTWVLGPPRMLAGDGCKGKPPVNGAGPRRGEGRSLYSVGKHRQQKGRCFDMIFLLNPVPSHCP